MFRILSQHWPIMYEEQQATSGSDKQITCLSCERRMLLQTKVEMYLMGSPSLGTSWSIR